MIELARSDLPGAPRAPTRLEEELLDHYIEALEQGRPDDVWKVSKLLSQGRQKALASSAHPLMARRRLRDGLVGLYVASLEQGRDADASKIAALAIHTTPGADVLLELAYEAQSRGLPRFEQFAWLHRVPDLTNHDAPRRRALRMVTYLDWALYEQACGRDFEPLTPEWRRPEIRAAHAAGEDRGR